MKKKYFLIFMLLFFQKLFSQNYQLNPDVKSFYETVVEKERLLKSRGKLENLRVKNILDRNISDNKSIILDVGGGMGVHAFYLSDKGHDLYLIDPVNHNINEAKEIAKDKNYNLKDFIVADARKLPFQDNSVDVVLLFGPLYHLDEKNRDIGLKEACRVLKPNGKLLAQSISSYCLLIDYFYDGKIKSIENQSKVLKNLKENSFIYNGGLFYTHTPEMIEKEVKQANFTNVKILSVEGFGSWFDKVYYEDENYQNMLLKFLEETEKEPSLVGISSHIMVIAEKK